MDKNISDAILRLQRMSPKKNIPTETKPQSVFSKYGGIAPDLFIDPLDQELDLSREAFKLVRLLSLKQSLGSNMVGVMKMGASQGAKGIDQGSQIMSKIDKQISDTVKFFTSNETRTDFLRQFADKLPQITQIFGNKNEMLYGSGAHRGTDFGTKMGDVVTLPKGNWRIDEAFNGAGDGGVNDWTNKGYGNSVLATNLDTGEKIRLSHLQQTDVKQGEIFKGGVVGTAGTSGHSTAVHTDVEYYDPKGNLGDVTKTKYVGNLFATKPTVRKSADTDMASLVNTAKSFIPKPVEASISTMRPAISNSIRSAQNFPRSVIYQNESGYKPKIPISTTPTPKPQITRPLMSKPSVNPSTPVKTSKPIVKPNPIQSFASNIVGAFSNMFGKRK